MADPAGTRGTRYMADQVSVVGIGMGALLIVGAIAFGVFAAFVAVHVGNDGQPPPRLAAGFRNPPAIAGPVALQPDPAHDIAAFRAQKRQWLGTYGWVDREHGIARIPIERAMALLARGKHADAQAR